MSELMPCPICGGRVKPATQVGEGFEIHCNCGVEYSGLCATAEDLHRNWNRRVDRTHIVSESATGFGLICQGSTFRGGCEPQSIEIPVHVRRAFESYLLNQKDDDECFTGPYDSAHKNAALHYWSAAIKWIMGLNP